ncbi:MAG: hypothetical protein QM488_04245 [Rhizobiaceae bacterium]
MRASIKEKSLGKAKDAVEDWYFQLLDKDRHGDILGEKTFMEASDRFEHEHEVLTEGERNASRGKYPVIEYIACDKH